MLIWHATYSCHVSGWKPCGWVGMVELSFLPCFTISITMIVYKAVTARPQKSLHDLLSYVRASSSSLCHVIRIRSIKKWFVLTPKKYFMHLLSPWFDFLGENNGYVVQLIVLSLYFSYPAWGGLRYDKFLHCNLSSPHLAWFIIGQGVNEAILICWLSHGN